MNAESALGTHAPTGSIASQGGTQAIRRAMAIVRMVASHGPTGAALNMIAGAMGLSQSTTHRILRCLVDEGLLKVDERRYTVGNFAFELSLCSLSGHQFAVRYSELVAAIARRIGHTTYLMVRSGADAVCLQKVEGTARMRVAPVDVGQRRPLGVGAGAIALLSALDRADIERHVALSARDLRAFGQAAPEKVLAMTLEAKDRGYAVSEGQVFNEITGIGVLIPDAPVPSIAVSITMPAAAVDRRTLPELAEAVREEIASILLRLREREDGGNGLGLLGQDPRIAVEATDRRG